MSKIYSGLLLFLFVFITGLAIAQETREVTGTVTDTDGTPVAGATVKVVGGRAGTSTDASGDFKFTILSSIQAVTVSGVGYQEQTVPLTGSHLKIQLVRSEGATEAGDEVVVVGYGTTTKEAFTGSAKVIETENLERKNVANISQALAGEAAGVRVINTSGQPGTEATIRIRGFGSVNGNRDPLYVVDGVPFTGSINAINMADVESTTILKDAAATAIYGSRGANGVVLINTKSGKSAQSYIEVDAKIGQNRQLIPRYEVIKSVDDFIGLSWESMYNDGVIRNVKDPVLYANDNLFGARGLRAGFNIWKITSVADLIDPGTRTIKPGVERKYSPENWEDYAFQTALRSEINVKMGGGDARTNYYSSLGYLKDVGYLLNSDFERATARLNLNHQVKPWLKTSMNLGYALSTRNRGGQAANSNSIFWFVDNIPPIYPLFLRDKEGNFMPDPYFGGNQYDYGENGRRFGSFTNAIADATYDRMRHKRNELNGNVGAVLNFLPELTFETSVGMQYFNNIYTILNNKFYGTAASQKGSLYQNRTNMFNYNFLKLLRYKKVFGDHGIEALAAHENNNWQEKTLTLSKYNLVESDNDDFNNAVVQNPAFSWTDEYALESYFGQINYDYKKTYYLSGTLRRDGSSRFLKNKWGTFGSIGGGWVISNESFMSSQSLFSNLKLKASYGIMGEQAGIGYYPGYEFMYKVENLNDLPALTLDTKGNPDLTWETSKMFQVGIEFKLKEFLTGSLDYYIKTTDNLIFDRRVGPSLGYALLKVNDGKLRNQGFEFDLTGHILNGQDYFLNVGVNGEVLRNKLLRMPIDPTTGKEKPIDIQGVYGRSVGHSIYDFYMRDFAGVDPQTGVSTWVLYYVDKDGNGKADKSNDPSKNEYIASLTQFLAENPGATVSQTTTTVYADATQYYIGKSAIPNVRGAFFVNGGYKGFDLSVQFLYSIGGYSNDAAYRALMNSGVIGGNNWHKDIYRRWQKAGDITNVPRLSNGRDAQANGTSTRFLTKASYLNLNNIRLGYTFSKSLLEKLRIGISDLNIWVSGDNLWLKTERKGFNPSTAEAGESDTYRYSPLSTLSAGVRVRL